jgi:hypothetical protein
MLAMTTAVAAASEMRGGESLMGVRDHPSRFLGDTPDFFATFSGRFLSATSRPLAKIRKICDDSFYQTVQFRDFMPALRNEID